MGGEVKKKIHTVFWGWEGVQKSILFVFFWGEGGLKALYHSIYARQFFFNTFGKNRVGGGIESKVWNRSILIFF